MKKGQFELLCKDLDESTDVKSVIDKYKNKSGWYGSRTLERYAMVHNLFKQGAGVDEVVQKAQWSYGTVEKLYNWWRDQVGGSNNGSEGWEQQDIRSVVTEKQRLAGLNLAGCGRMGLVTST